MALPHAILASLCERSGSGYELAQRFDRSIGQFWSATHQQIYRTLRAMEGHGWVQVSEVAQQGRPDKKVYTVSEAGRAELSRWITQSPPPAGKRARSSVADNSTRDLAVKLRGAAPGDLDALRNQIVDLRAEHAALLDTYRDQQKHRFPDPMRLSGAALHQYLVLRGGIRAEEGTVDWLDEVLTAVGGPR